jgi:hypothetical protein
VVAGVVEVPRHGETFTAVIGHGAWLHRGGTATRLRCNTGVPLDRALVSTGFGYDPGRRQVQGEVVAALLPHIRDIRRGGSAAVDLCSVAAGRLDGLYERGLNYWDYAAGGLIAREAGALVGGLAGRPESTSMTVAAGPDLFRQLDAFLTRLNPEWDAQRTEEQNKLADLAAPRYGGAEPDAGPGQWPLPVIGVPRVRRARTWQNSRPESGTTRALKALQPRNDCALRNEGGWSTQMAQDYDSPRKTDDDLTEDSLQELQARRMDKSSSTIDLDPDDVAESLELPGADLSNEELSFRVIPRQADEFTCSRCFLVHHRSQLAEDRNGQLVCRECAA